MAIYHCSIKIFTRGKGASAVAKAAYRAAEIIHSEYDGNTYDYSRKRGIVHKEILLPGYAPPEYADRTVLWNAVEKSERNINAQLAREIEVSLPVELSREQSINLVREYVKRQFVEQGMCADLCVHDTNGVNPHAHIMLTIRPINEDGTWGAKSKKEYVLNEYGERIRLKNGSFKTRKICAVDWNEPTKAEEWRSAWADAVNAALEKEHIAQRIDHRSYTRQGIEQIPTVHMGVAASQMEKRGIRTERGEQNRAIENTNQQLRQLRARLFKLEGWLKTEIANPGQLDLADVLQGILSRRAQSGKSGISQSVYNLKDASRMLIFLTDNKITDMQGLQKKVESMYSRNQKLRDDLKPVERRINTLKEHIRQAETYRKYKGKKARTESEEILFQSAKKYLSAHLNGYKLDLSAWKRELGSKTSEKEALYREYYALKDETVKVEHIKRGIESILRENSPKAHRQRNNERV